MPGHQVFPGMIPVIGENSFNGEPVDMYIPDRHENGNLYSFIFKIFLFFCGFNSNDSAVSRSINPSGREGRNSFWNPEKPEDKYHKPG